jgi:hypothetical protein
MRSKVGIIVPQGKAGLGTDRPGDARGCDLVRTGLLLGGRRRDGHCDDLLAPGTVALAAVNAVVALGATVAPAAPRLLGRVKPLRAVLGHVEPTFDRTLRVGETGQGLGGHLVSALSTNLFVDRQPLGYAFADYRAGVGELQTQWAEQYERLADGQTQVRETLTRLRLTAIDRQSLVLLGDPTVTLPSLQDAP